MVHSQRPLQEKMALFWHNHFATAYSKIAGVFGAVQATKMMALKAGELPGPQGQIELFRQYALGNFRNLLIEVAKDPAMLVWLDGRTNTRARPQENFGREIMELFTFGVGNYTEQDVYAAARVFTGWNLRTVANRRRQRSQHLLRVLSTTPTSTTRRRRRSPSASTATATRRFRRAPAADGMQDGIDFISALARHPETARRLARKLWNFFVSDFEAPDPAFVESDRGRVPAQQHRDEAGDQRTSCDRAGFSTRRAGTRATRGRWSSSSARFGRSAGKGFRSTRRGRR